MRWEVLPLVACCLIVAGCGGDTTTVIREVRPESAAPASQGTALELKHAAIAEGTSCGGYGSEICRLSIEISTIDPDWGAIHVVPRIGHESEMQTDSAAYYFHRGEWRLIQAGNGGGCDVPQRIADELGLACY